MAEPPDRESGGRRRSFLALLMSVILLAALGGGVYWGVGRIQEFFNAPDYTAVGTQTVTVEVKAGTITDTANTLYDGGVVKSAKAYIEAAEDDPRSTNVQPGFYKLVKQMPAKEALARLLDPERNRVVNRVTVTEGEMTLDIYAKLAKALDIPVKDFVEAGGKPRDLGVADWWFKRDDGKRSATTVEGFLFPATYEFAPDVTAKEALSQMVEKFNEVTTELTFADTVQTTLNISPYEALIAASIAQAEVSRTEDFDKVTRVIYNRAYKGGFPCACLGMDTTVNYYLRLTGAGGARSEHLTQAQIHDPDNPYNTHDKAGLPLGPIGNPGRDTLRAAMTPAKGPWTYFVTIDKSGTTAFATTLDEHARNIRTACRNGIPLC
ncbi:endolytic transglycosylase MltG [Luedemannella flava]